MEPLVHTNKAFRNAMHSRMPRENEINMVCVIVHFYRLLCGFVSNGKQRICIYEKSFQVTRRIRRPSLSLTCDCTIIISYTRSNKNINKKYENTLTRTDRYLRINFVFTALTYAPCTLGSHRIFIHVDISFILLYPFCIWIIFFLHFFHRHWKSITSLIPLERRKPTKKRIKAISLFPHLLYRWCADFVCECLLCVVITAIRIGFKLITFGRFNFDFHTNGTQIKSIRGWWFWLRPMMMIKPTYTRQQHVASVYIVVLCGVAHTFLANWMYWGVRTVQSACIAIKSRL